MFNLEGDLVLEGLCEIEGVSGIEGLELDEIGGLIEVLIILREREFGVFQAYVDHTNSFIDFIRMGREERSLIMEVTLGIEGRLSLVDNLILIGGGEGDFLDRDMFRVEDENGFSIDLRREESITSDDGVGVEEEVFLIMFESNEDTVQCFEEWAFRI